jgi:uncharacterized protein (DUF1778 family)
MNTIKIRIQEEDVALLDQAAHSLGITRSALIRHGAEAHARRILSLPDDGNSDPR